jgi:hypothetical protein
VQNEISDDYIQKLCRRLYCPSTKHSSGYRLANAKAMKKVFKYLDLQTLQEKIDQMVQRLNVEVFGLRKPELIKVRYRLPASHEHEVEGGDRKPAAKARLVGVVELGSRKPVAAFHSDEDTWSHDPGKLQAGEWESMINMAADKMIECLYQLTYDNDGRLSDRNVRDMLAATRLSRQDRGAALRYMRTYLRGLATEDTTEGSFGIENFSDDFLKGCVDEFVEFARRRKPNSEQQH